MHFVIVDFRLQWQTTKSNQAIFTVIWVLNAKIILKSNSIQFNFRELDLVSSRKKIGNHPQHNPIFIIFRSICKKQEKLFIQYSVQWR